MVMASVIGNRVGCHSGGIAECSGRGTGVDSRKGPLLEKAERSRPRKMRLRGEFNQGLRTPFEKGSRFIQSGFLKGIPLSGGNSKSWAGNPYNLKSGRGFC